jgi:topoisomerase-4 subunit B
MNPKSRVLLRVTLPAARNIMGLSDEDNDMPSLADVDDLVERLMGKNAEARFNFIQDNAEFVQDLDI